MAKYTGEDLVRAIELNGYQKASGRLIRYKGWRKHNILTPKDNVEIEAACAIGQGALNLGVTADIFQLALGDVGIPPMAIIKYNDKTAMRPNEIAKRLRKRFSASLTKEVEFRGSLDNPYENNPSYQGVKIKPRD